MKFRVTNKVFSFGVDTAVYYPGDIVEGPESWIQTNAFLEPLPEPKPEPLPEPKAEHVPPKQVGTPKKVREHT